MRRSIVYIKALCIYRACRTFHAFYPVELLSGYPWKVNKVFSDTFTD